MSSISKIEYQKKELPSRLQSIGLLLTVLGIVIVLAGYLINPDRMAFNNIIGLTFIISIAVGALFFVAIEYLSGAVWSTPFRRITEIVSSFVIIVPLFVIPLLLNVHSVFHWTHPEAVNADKILSAKAPYLNVNFFIIRVIAFIAIWMLFQYLITKNSKIQDSSKDQTLTSRNIKLSAIFIPFFALTISFTGIDWLMSLEPHWFSTIFGIYYFSGTVLAALATVTFIAVKLNENGFLVKGLIADHYYSLGALLFAFINFWAYIAFSQFLLIWYANLPEETFWFLQRWEGSWVLWTIGLMIVHFIVPYFGLLSQPSKMDPKKLKFFSLWILAAHYYDLYFLVMPNYSKSGVALSWYEIGFPVLTVGLMIILFINKSKKENLVPIGDPKLKRGIDFRL